jgi:hypothetical protein
MRRGLVAIAILSLLLVAVARRPAAACSPGPQIQVYPASGRVVPANAVPRALVAFGGVEPDGIELARDGVPVTTAVEVDDVALGWLRAYVITPADLLSPGQYRLSAGELEPTEFAVVEGEDVSEPPAATDIAVHATWVEGDECVDGSPRVSLTLTQADDDWTPAESLAYHVYVATTPDQLAFDDVPSLPALSRTRGDRGSELLIEAPLGPEPRQPLTPGTWYVAIRAIDEAGNLGPASAPVAFAVPDGGGCAAAGGGRGALGALAVVIALLVGRKAGPVPGRLRLHVPVPRLGRGRNRLRPRGAGERGQVHRLDQVGVELDAARRRMPVPGHRDEARAGARPAARACW